jgi:hypothetical protein
MMMRNTIVFCVVSGVQEVSKPPIALHLYGLSDGLLDLQEFQKAWKRGLAKAEKPFFKKQVIMLDDRLFSLNLEGWEASIAVEGGS